MAQANGENLRAYLEQWSGETLRPEARPGEVFDLALLDPDVVYEDANLPDHAGEPYRSHEGVARAMERWIEPFEWMVIDLEQIIDAGDRLASDTTALPSTLGGRGTPRPADPRLARWRVSGRAAYLRRLGALGQPHARRTGGAKSAPRGA